MRIDKTILVQLTKVCVRGESVTVVPFSFSIRL